MQDLSDREHSLFTSTISGEKDGAPTIIGQDLTTLAKNQSFAFIIGSLWLARPLRSKVTENIIDHALKLLVDHGPHVSGAVNTMITARAGRDLVSSLVSGLLTIGPRFGGAVNEAASVWLSSVKDSKKATELVESFAKQKKYLPGIGHKKYRLDAPDPRVTSLTELLQGTPHPHLDFAQAVEKLTTAKKPNLILNVDGALAAILLDTLIENEGFSQDEVEGFIKAEFFNSFFVLSRSVGFIAHYLDQKRLDEGLFRLPDNQVLLAEPPTT